MTLGWSFKFAIFQLSNERVVYTNFKISIVAGGELWVVECLPSGCEALSSNPSTVKKNISIVNIKYIVEKAYQVLKNS
jgi:hypothetical protein